MRRVNLFLLLLLSVIVLTSCNKKSNDETMPLVIAKWNGGGSVSFEDASTVSFDKYANGVFVSEKPEYTLELSEELAPIIGDIKRISYLQDGTTYRAREESEFKKKKVAGITLKYFTEDNRTRITIVQECLKYGLYTRYKVAIVTLKNGMDVEAAVDQVGKILVNSSYLKMDNIIIGDNEFTILNVDGIDNFTDKFIASGNKWGIAKKGVLKKTAGFNVWQGNNFEVKYKADYNMSSIIRRN